MAKCFNCEYLMKKYCGKPTHEKLFEMELHGCRAKNLTLSYEEVRVERECDLFKESKRWIKI